MYNFVIDNKWCGFIKISDFTILPIFLYADNQFINNKI